MTYIVIEGVIGVGKTSLAQMLSESLNMPAVLEEIDVGDVDRVKRILSNFYKDRARYAFQTEVFFLLNRYRQQQAVVKPVLTADSLVSDYLFAKTRLFADMNLGGDERDLFDELFEALSRQVEKPDLLVYLTASVDTLMARIFQRDRPYERSMERAYIARLAEVYEDFFEAYAETRVLRIDTENLDIVRDPEAQKRVITLITKAASLA